MEREEAPDANATGDAKPDILSIQYHGFVTDTVDGGIAPWLGEIGGRPIPSYEQGGDDPKTRKAVNPATLKPEQRSIPAQDDHGKGEGEEKLLVQCHCGGVSFDILRSQRPVTEKTWWLRGGGPSNATRYRTGFCVCRSCRLALGQPLQPWTYVETTSLRDTSNGSAIGESVAAAADAGLLGTLKRYQSTPGVWHDFCGTCGATVFYESEGRTAEMEGLEVVDVAVGILRPGGAIGVGGTVGVGDGVRCEAWLEWELSRVSNRDYGLETELIEAFLKNGSRSESKR